MATPKMTKMGIKRKDMHAGETASPMAEKDYDKEEVRPSMHLSGEHARMMGAEDLKKGDRVQQTCEWVVTEHTKREENGKDPEYSMTLELDKGSDCTECGSEDGDEEGKTDAKTSAGLDYVMGKAKAE